MSIGATNWVVSAHNTPEPSIQRVYARSIKFEHGCATVSADVRLVQGKCIRPGVFWLAYRDWMPESVSSGASTPTTQESD